MTPAADLVSVEYDRHKAEVIRTVAAKLAASGVSGSEGDLDASYNEAWHALYLALDEGEEIENRVGYLVTVTHRRALNEIRALKVDRRADPAAIDMAGIELDLDARLDAEIQLRHIREGFRSKLSARELEAATLCHLYGYTRPEAAEAMGVKPKRMEKIMDRASGKISSVVETVRSGEHCAGFESTVRAFALGVLDPDGEKYALAVDHLEHCSACRREVWTERGLAAIGPPLPIAFALLAGGATTGGGLAAGLAVKGGASGGAATAKAGAAGASAGRKAALVGGGTASVAAAAVAVAVATGAIGGGGKANDASAPAPAPAVAASATGGSKSGTPAKSAAPPKQDAGKKSKKARVKKQTESSSPEVTYVPEPEYVPPPPPPVPVTEPPPVPPEEPVEPAPVKPVEPKPVEPVKPTTDAGEEFGLR